MVYYKRRSNLARFIFDRKIRSFRPRQRRDKEGWLFKRRPSFINEPLLKVKSVILTFEWGSNKRKLINVGLRLRLSWNFGQIWKFNFRIAFLSEIFAGGVSMDCFEFDELIGKNNLSTLWKVYSAFASLVLLSFVFREIR